MSTTLTLDEQEKFRPVHGFEGIYSIGSNGSVVRHQRQSINRNGIKSLLSERRLKCNLVRGYKCVALTDGMGRSEYTSVHRAVAKAFLGLPAHGKMQVNHKDGVKTNNNFSNLEWVTNRENILHAHRIGLAPIGECRAHAKLTDDQVLEIRRLRNRNYVTLSFLAKKYGVSITSIHKIIQHKRWNHVKAA